LFWIALAAVPEILAVSLSSVARIVGPALHLLESRLNAPEFDLKRVLHFTKRFLYRTRSEAASDWTGLFRIRNPGKRIAHMA